MMTIKEMEKAIMKIKKLEMKKAEIEAEITAMQDEIKEVMTSSGEDTMTVGAFKVSWKSVSSSRFDTAALKKALPDVADRFMNTVSYRRFLIN